MSRFALILCALVLASCGMKKNLKETHDATVAVQKNSDEMYSDMKEDATGTSRRDSWEKLLAEQDPSKRLVLAAHYVRSFEFQLWSGIGRDTNSTRLTLAKKNTEEFMVSVKGLVLPDQTMPMPLANSVLNPFRVNRLVSFNSIAATLDEYNPKQDRLAAETRGLKPLSFLSMLETSLKASFERNLGQSIAKYPAYVEQILNHERVAKLLMQTRMNYLVMIALDKASDISKGGVDLIQMRLGKWNLKLEDRGVGEVSFATQKIHEAAETFEFLRSVGIEPIVAPGLAKILAQVQIGADVLAHVEYVNFETKKARLAGTKFTPAQLESRPFVEAAFLRELNAFRIQAGILPL